MNSLITPEWIAKRRQLEQESRPSGYGLVPTNAVNRYHADTLRSLPLALNALEAVLKVSTPRTAPAYAWESMDGWSDGYDQAMEDVRAAIETVLNPPTTDHKEKP